jgi:hypothetical protein
MIIKSKKLKSFFHLISYKVISNRKDYKDRKLCISHNVIKYMLKKNFISEYNIILYRKASFCLSNTFLKSFVEDDMKDVP